jgi:CDP-diacylglycerol--glycerol-3-phosphate 3-phosphatidyltransferase
LPSVYQLKPAFQGLLRPLVRSLVSAGVTPNHLTLAAAVGSIAIGLALTRASGLPGLLLLLPAWLLARMALNAMDGMAAREHGMTSRLGGVLNELGDVVSDLALYVPLATLGPAHLWSSVTFAILAALTEFCGLIGPVRGGARRYDGPMGKSDRALVVGLLGLIGGIAPGTIAWWPPVLWFASSLAVLTCWNRAAGAYRTPPTGSRA